MIWLANNHWIENRIANEKEKEMKPSTSNDMNEKGERKEEAKYIDM